MQALAAIFLGMMLNGIALGQATSSSENQLSQKPANATSQARIATYSTNDFNVGGTNGFFAPQGTNGRTCETCHRADNAWSLTPAYAAHLARTNRSDPLFAPVDGSDCPATSADRPDAKKSLMLIRYGLIREHIGIPAGADFSLITATNPKKCSIPPADPAIGGKLVLYRRPLPATNLNFLSTVRWDGRENVLPITTGISLTDLEPLSFDLGSQANHASITHEQSASIDGSQAQVDIIQFEQNLYTAATAIGKIDLTPIQGGPEFIAQYVAPAFFIGQNDPLGPDFSSTIFTLYKEWEPDEDGHFVGRLSQLQRAIGRGEKLFNTRTFTIKDVPGLNSETSNPLFNPDDPFSNTPLTGTCGTCHNTFNIGNHSTSLPLNIGVTMAKPTDNDGREIHGILDIRSLPVYTMHSLTGYTIRVTDPGRALISGKWVDVGKTKGPMLRGLFAHAPYFHNGSADSLDAVIRYYNVRFQIGLTPGEMHDLATFLSAL